MIGDSCGNEQQEYVDPNERYKEEDTVEHGAPHQQQGDDFGSQRDGFVFAVVTNIGAQMLLIEQPLVESGRCFEVKRRREQQEGCGWEQWYKDAQNAQCQRETTQKNADRFHAAKIRVGFDINGIFFSYKDKKRYFCSLLLLIYLSHEKQLPLFSFYTVWCMERCGSDNGRFVGHC